MTGKTRWRGMCVCGGGKRAVSGVGKDSLVDWSKSKAAAECLQGSANRMEWKIGKDKEKDLDVKCEDMRRWTEIWGNGGSLLRAQIGRRDMCVSVTTKLYLLVLGGKKKTTFNPTYSQSLDPDHADEAALKQPGWLCAHIEHYKDQLIVPTCSEMGWKHE